MEPDERWDYEDKLIDLALGTIDFSRYSIDIDRHEFNYEAGEDEKQMATEIGVPVEEIMAQHSLPNRVGFFWCRTKIGEINYYTEPIKVVSLDEQFKPYATLLERLLVEK